MQPLVILISLACVSAVSAGCFWHRRPNTSVLQSNAPPVKELGPSIEINPEIDASSEDQVVRACLSDKPVQQLNPISALRVPHEYISQLKLRGLIGVGACGRTYLGSWGSQPVSVKVMEHVVRKSNSRLLGEMPVLTTPVVHPNTLQMFRVRSSVWLLSS